MIFILGTHALPHVGSGKKNEVAVIVLAFAQQLILPKVLQCDLDAVKRLIAGLEAEPTSVTSQETVQAILDERCDGGRNIFHVAVSMCQPTSNKDSDQDAYTSSTTSFSTAFDHIESASRAMNLRAMVERAAAASRMNVNLSAAGSSDASPNLRPASGSSVAPPGDSSPPVMDEPPSFSALAWPPPAASEAAFEANPNNPGNEPGNAGADVDSLLGLASAAAASAASSAKPSTSKFPMMMTSSKPHILDNVERRANALAILKLVCDSPVFLHRLEAILASRDAQGNTPFMAAVANRYVNSSFH